MLFLHFRPDLALDTSHCPHTPMHTTHTCLVLAMVVVEDVLFVLRRWKVFGIYIIMERKERVGSGRGERLAPPA